MNKALSLFARSGERVVQRSEDRVSRLDEQHLRKCIDVFTHPDIATRVDPPFCKQKRG